MSEFSCSDGHDAHPSVRRATFFFKTKRTGILLAACALPWLIFSCGRNSGNANGDGSGGSAGPAEATGGSGQTDNTGGKSSGGAPADGGSTGAATGGAASDPFAQGEKCTSGKNWSNGYGSTMRPGTACISCHSASGGPRFAAAGTVYSTGHEPDDCNGAGNADAVVVITDADGKEHELSVNQAGNFTLSGSLAMPYAAKVVAGGVERAMGSSQSTGDCNNCHTQSGGNGAPGRIVLP